MYPTSYPVELHAPRPEQFERVQVAIRLLVLMALGMLSRGGGGLGGLIYFFLPIAAAILVSRRSATGFPGADRRWLLSVLRWVVALYAYLMFVADRFPMGTRDLPVRLTVHPSGTATAGSALLRLVTSLPHFLVLGVLGIASSLVALVLAIGVLISGRCSPTLHSFQRDVLTWMARVLAYHASFVQQYPPFHLGSAPPAAHAPSGA